MVTRHPCGSAGVESSCRNALRPCLLRLRTPADEKVRELIVSDCLSGNRSRPLDDLDWSKKMRGCRFVSRASAIPFESVLRSMFISLDGLDGTGKSTQCRLLADWLRNQGHEVLICSDPGGTEVGKVLRTLLLEHKSSINLPCEALLFMASRAQLVGEVIRPALACGQIVISDRFLLANVVYQGHAGGLDPELLWRIGLFATQGLEPDLTLILDLPPQVASSRLSGPRDRLESRPVTYQERVREGFRKEASAHPDKMHIIDASGTIELVHAAICEQVTAQLKLAGKRR
jgi:dTMP kinase